MIRILSHRLHRRIGLRLLTERGHEPQQTQALAALMWVFLKMLNDFIFLNNHVHTQPHMQVVKLMPKQGEGLQPPRVSDTLANQEPEVKRKWLNNNDNKGKREKEVAPLNHDRMYFIKLFHHAV